MSSLYEIFIGRRYLRSARGNRFVSFISVTSMAGVAVGVAVLIVVLSVMNGFESELRERILSLTAHATISGFNGGLEHWRTLDEKVRHDPAVVAAAPYIEDQALLIAGGKSSGAMVRGVEPAAEQGVSSIAARMRTGRLQDLQPGHYDIVLGADLANALKVKVGDSVILVIAQGNVTPVGVMPRMRRFHVTGIFAAGMYEYDRNFAYVSLQDAATLYRLGDEVTGLRLKLQNLFQAPSVVRRLATDLGGGYYVDDWTRKHSNFFRSIEMTKTVMFVILLLVVAVAAFNIVSTLVMVVKDKQADIAILRTLGSTPRSVMSVFILQGTAIGVIGTLAGVALGVVLSINLESVVHLLESVLGTHFLDAKVYFMSDLPARVEWGDVARICFTALVLCSLSTLYPAWRAAHTEPARALRHD